MMLMQWVLAVLFLFPVLVLAGGAVVPRGRWAPFPWSLVGTDADRGVPLAAAFLVIGSVTLTAMPLPGGLGARVDDPALRSRNHPVGWPPLAAVVGVATAATVLLRDRRGTPRRSGD